MTKARASTDNGVIITCAITGAETTRDRQPNLPITPKEQAQAAYDAVQAGASIIHLHVREDDGRATQRLERFKESIDAIRNRCPGVIIQISTGGAIGESIDNRARPLELKPEMASLNVGTLNFGDEVFLNSPPGILALAEQMKRHGVRPELEVYEAGMLESAFGLIQRGHVPGADGGPVHVQFVLGVPGGMSGDVRNLMHLVSLLQSRYPTADWGVAGIGRYQLPLAVHALVMGGHVRVGFEDNIFYRKGELATSNAQLVERIARIATEVGRKVLSPEESRLLLDLSR